MEGVADDAIGAAGGVDDIGRIVETGVLVLNSHV
jgi:hypothetical protein